MSGATEIVAVDVGGTNARFARATIAAGQSPRLGEAFRYDTADHADLAGAWAAFARDSGGALPARAAIAVAGPVGGELIRFTNSPWVLRPDGLAAELGVDQLVLLNDFGAMAHAVPWIGAGDCLHIAGPQAWPDDGMTSVIGPGTGLGVAASLSAGGRHFAIETEGGHIDFAPLDSLEARIAERLRTRFRRCSAERLVSGPGLGNIREALAAIAGEAFVPGDDKSLWAAAIAGDDPLAAQALDRLVLAFGAIAGDIALAQGANAVMIVGSLANRIAGRLAGPAFVDRFVAKGRHETRMRALPIRLCRHPQPGLLGAAAAFQHEHLDR